MPRDYLKVFLSSTSRDLHEYRAVARNVILEMGCYPEMMEYFGALPTFTIEACQDKLKDCDVVLLLVAFQRGSVPDQEHGGDGTSSYTALELACADTADLPVLAMLASECWPQNLCEDDPEARSWVKRFRNNINRPAEFFDHEEPAKEEERAFPAFRTKVRKVLLAYRESLATQPQAQANEVEYFDSARSLIVEGDCIPFVGPGVHCDALSTSALVRELWPRAPAEQACLATAAEYAEKVGPSREKFLQRFERILSEQSRRCPASPAIQMVARLRLRPPPLVVSGSHDLVMEDRLGQVGSCAIVAHIIRSKGGEHDGKLLVISGDKSWICVADKLDVGNPDFVVYKPLGSPLLHAKLDAALEIDTVVVTEADHAVFVGMLENKVTTIPTTFHRPFQKRSIVFLGLPLDVWHYRLVLNIFRSRSVDLGSKPSPGYTIGQPTTAVEQLVWRKLDANLIPMDVNVFAARVLEALEPRVPGV